MDWLIPVLRIAAVAAGLMAGTNYLNVERKIQANEALRATLDRVYQDQQLSLALKALHNGEGDQAAQRLDLLLCGHILTTNSELASADGRTRIVVEDAFRRIARVRPKAARGAAAGSTHECIGDQAAAERVLELALAGDHTARMK